MVLRLCFCFVALRQPGDVSSLVAIGSGLFVQFSEGTLVFVAVCSCFLSVGSEMFSFSFRRCSSLWMVGAYVEASTSAVDGRNSLLGGVCKVSGSGGLEGVGVRVPGIDAPYTVGEHGCALAEGECRYCGLQSLTHNALL